jgi:hypothetical protein
MDSVNHEFKPGEVIEVKVYRRGPRNGPGIWRSTSDFKWKRAVFVRTIKPTKVYLPRAFVMMEDGKYMQPKPFHDIRPVPLSDIRPVGVEE